MKIVVAPDKFKGSLSAKEVCKAVEEGVHEVFPEADVSSVPMADGGEGTLDMLVESLDLKRVRMTVQDPLFRNIEAQYAITGKDAYIEMALASGLQLLTPIERNAMKTSSIGVGQLISDALNRGAENVYLFVGGSATNDGGIGMASALGYRFLDQSGKEVIPIGENLIRVKSIGVPEKLPAFNLVVVTDVKNTLLGPGGATFQYGPQKGVKPEDLSELEDGLNNLSSIVETAFEKQTKEIPGSGAAGGIAVCAMGLLDGEVRSGIDLMLELADFGNKVQEANLVITGEGKMDVQTLEGKVVFGVAKAAKEQNKKVIAVCGDSDLNSEQLRILKIDQALKLKADQLSVEYCVQNASTLIKERITDYLKDIK